MNRMPAMILVASAALAAPAFADTVTYTAPDRVVVYDVDPVTGSYMQRSTTVYNRDGSVTTTYSTPLPPENISLPTAPSLTYSSPEPVTYVEPGIVVTAPRGSQDQMITNDVVDRIAADPRVSGQVGVETFRNEVTLTGKVTSPAQAERAASDARSVPGVRDVNNEIRSRVGNF